MKSKQTGFTLIELLVVIAIIGLLSTLAVVALNNARLKSRDAKRVADVKQIQTALELYFNECNGYPTQAEGSLATDATLNDGATTCAEEFGTYMNQIPTNPTPRDEGACSAFNTDYLYASANAGTYTIKYCLAGNTGNISAGEHVATPSGMTDD